MDGASFRGLREDIKPENSFVHGDPSLMDEID